MARLAAALFLLLLLLAVASDPANARKKPSTVIKDKIIQRVFMSDPSLAASALRLMFHDCVGDLGMCDGCLKFSQVANNGLAIIKAR